MQQSPLMQTKLYFPPVRLELVSRSRLIERFSKCSLNGGRVNGD
jgi:hypothetical protein